MKDVLRALTQTHGAWQTPKESEEVKERLTRLGEWSSLAYNWCLLLIISPERIRISSIIQTEQVVFGTIYVHACMRAITINKKRS